MSGLMEDIGRIIGFSMIALYPHLSRKVKDYVKGKSDYLNSNSKLRRQIKEIIKEIRIHMEANRAVMVEFSNTEKSTSNFPFEFASITYEELDNNVVPIQQNVKKTPVSLLLDWTEPVENDNARFRIFQYEDITNTEFVNFRMKELSMSSIIVFKITNKLKDGFIGIHHTQPYEEDWNTSDVKQANEDFIYLKFQCSRIYSIMKQLKR